MARVRYIELLIKSLLATTVVHIDSLFSVHPISSSFQSHPPERNNPLWFRSFSDGPTGARREVAAATARGGSTSAWIWRERDFQGQKALLFFPPTPPCCSLLVVLLITISTLNVLCLTMTKATLRTVFIANKHTRMLIV